MKEKKPNRRRPITAASHTVHTLVFPLPSLSLLCTRCRHSQKTNTENGCGAPPPPPPRRSHSGNLSNLALLFSSTIQLAADGSGKLLVVRQGEHFWGGGAEKLQSGQQTMEGNRLSETAEDAERRRKGNVFVSCL